MKSWAILLGQLRDCLYCLASHHPAPSNLQLYDTRLSRNIDDVSFHGHDYVDVVDKPSGSVVLEPGSSSVLGCELLRREAKPDGSHSEECVYCWCADNISADGEVRNTGARLHHGSTDGTCWPTFD